MSASPTKQARSPFVGCLGLLLIPLCGLLTVGGLLGIGKAENIVIHLGFVCIFALLTLLGAVSAYYGFSQRLVPGVPDFTDAKREQEALRAVLDSSHPVSQAVNAAASLLLDRRYEEAFQAYRAIAEAHPAERGTAYSQMGAALYFLGRYNEAIQYYEQALAHGANPEMIRDNIEEAQAALR